MTRPASQWSELDKELMRSILTAWEKTDNPPSLRSAARSIGVSAPRLMDLRDGSRGKPTVDEYINLCRLFHLDPAETLESALQATGR